MRKRLWDLAKSRIEIGTILPGHRHKVRAGRGRSFCARRPGALGRRCADNFTIVSGGSLPTPPRLLAYTPHPHPLLQRAHRLRTCRCSTRVNCCASPGVSPGHGS